MVMTVVEVVEVVVVVAVAVVVTLAIQAPLVARPWHLFQVLENCSPAAAPRPRHTPNAGAHRRPDLRLC